MRKIKSLKKKIFRKKIFAFLDSKNRKKISTIAINLGNRDAVKARRPDV